MRLRHRPGISDERPGVAGTEGTMSDAADRSDREQGPFDGLAVTEARPVDVVERLRAEGFDAHLVFEPDDIPPGLFCRRCGRRHLPARATVHELHRVSGPSPASYEALVVALECPRCGARGSIVTGYGPTATAQEEELHHALASSLGGRGGT